MIKPLRGMKDLMFEDAERFVYTLEETALFKRSVGDSSDIVSKEMYQFEDKGGNDVCMRPEGTAGVVRAFLF